MIRVLLVPKYMSREELGEKGIIPTATVEAEYGSQVIEGDVVTLAHHAPQYEKNPAPCNTENVPTLEDGATIVVSHLDLDTLGGIAALRGEKKEDKEFWKAAEYIDLNGPHHLFELAPKVREKYVAYQAYQTTHRLPRFTEITDVTDLVNEHLGIINRAIEGEPQLIQEGKTWEKDTNNKIESCIVFENSNVRVFDSPEGVFCSAAYYSEKQGKIIPSTVTLNGRFKSVTVALADGGKELSEKNGKNARDIVQELWGNEAGGHPGIAGSPRGQEMTKEDLWQLADVINEQYNKARGTNEPIIENRITLNRLSKEIEGHEENKEIK